MARYIYAPDRTNPMNDEIRVIVIDDEELWLRGICSTLQEFGYAIAGTADSFEAAVALFRSVDYDIALVDIGLEAKNEGIELGRMLSRVYNRPYIFITGNLDDNLVRTAISVRPSGYLSKPVHPISLMGTVQSAINNFYNRDIPYVPSTTAPVTASNFFFVKKGSKYTKIDWANVVYMRSDKNYTSIYNGDDKREYCIRSTLSKTIKFIIPPQLRQAFVQVNRAEVVNTAYMREVVDSMVKTTAGSFALSDSYKADFKKAVPIFA